MLSGELASRAAKLKREQQERIERRQQRELADRDALRRQQERLQAAEEEGRRRRLEELARQDELRLQVRMHFVPEPPYIRHVTVICPIQQPYQAGVSPGRAACSWFIGLIWNLPDVAARGGHRQQPGHRI